MGSEPRDRAFMGVVFPCAKIESDDASHFRRTEHPSLQANPEATATGFTDGSWTRSPAGKSYGMSSGTCCSTAKGIGIYGGLS